MALTAPDWLTRHNGTMRPNATGCSWTVYFADQPQYLLVPVPVAGKHGCRVTQTINGRQLPSEGVYPSAEEAILGGLEDLRKALGW